MPRISSGLFIVSVVAALYGGSSHSAFAAAEQIGLAVIVRNNVSQVEPVAAKILQGDDVVRDEVVKTLADSNAKIVLKDSTNLMLGPNSTLKLDRAVFSGDKNFGEVALKMGLGTFRFITGNSPKESYSISTPIATMGVRGTTVDFNNTALKSTAVLQDGQATVCAGGRCLELLRKGDTAVVTRNGNRIEIELQPSSWSFDSECRGMCSVMTFAQAQDSLTTGSLGGGGGGGGGTGAGGGGLNAISGGGIFPALVPGTGTQSPGLLVSPGLGSAAAAPTRISDN